MHFYKMYYLKGSIHLTHDLWADPSYINVEIQKRALSLQHYSVMLRIQYQSFYSIFPH